MADPSISLLIGGTILLVGFGAYLVFQRYHIPDFLVLIVLGAVLYELPVAPFGPNLLSSLKLVLPLFLQLTIAFILFEGGLSLKIRQVGRAIGPLMVHVVGAFLLTFFLIWLFATRVLGLSEVASLILAVAMANPSASIALSFAPRMRLSERAEAGVILEGVITNVFAVMGILYILQWAGAGSQLSLLAYGLQTALAAAVAVGVALGWRAVSRRLRGKEFLFIASLAVAVIVYAIAQLFLFQNGAVAVFLFGLVLGYHRPATISEHIDEFVGEFTRPVEHLRSFQSEVTFALRTFFFLYLGLLLLSEWGGVSTIGFGALLTVAFVVGRVPTSLGIGAALHFPKRERRVLLASMGRGLTDVILILLATQTAVIPDAEASVMLSLLPTAVLFSAFVCAGLLVWAGRAPVSSDAPAAGPTRVPRGAAPGPNGAGDLRVDRPSPAGPQAAYQATRSSPELASRKARPPGPIP